MAAKTVKPKPAPRARPTTQKPRSTDAEKVDLTRSITTALKASPDWPAATDVQASVTSWNALADVMATSDQQIATLRDQLSALIATQHVNRQKWSVLTRQVFTNVDAHCGGDVEKIHGFGLTAQVRGTPVVITTPANVTTSLGKWPGQTIVTWDHVPYGVLVQHASDAANAATYSMPVACTKRRVILTGVQAPISVRVAAIDPSAATGLSAWSAWVSAPVR